MSPALGESSELAEAESRCRWALAGDGSILTASWDDLSGQAPARRARRLEHVGRVAQLLDVVGPALERARPLVETDLREYERAEDRKLERQLEDGRIKMREHELGAEAALADLRRKIADAEREGKTEQAENYRIQLAIPQMTVRAAQEGEGATDSWADVVRQLNELGRTLDKVLDRVHKAREKGRDARRRTRWVNPLVIGVFGLLAGVIATQLLQEQTEDIGAAVPWVVAVVAWALLDYFLEPRLRLRLANRQLEKMREEVTLTFQAWRHLRTMEAKLGRERLPAWSTMREHTSRLPPLGS